MKYFRKTLENEITRAAKGFPATVCDHATSAPAPLSPQFRAVSWRGLHRAIADKQAASAP